MRLCDPGAAADVSIHPTAIIDDGARLKGRIRIEPYAKIGPDVVVENGSWIGSHVSIQGPAHIGPDNRIHPFTLIGGASAIGTTAARVEIGRGNSIREYCEIRGAANDDPAPIRIGDNNYVMAYVQLAQGCTLRHDIIITNGVILGAHVHLAAHVYLGPFSTLQAGCRFGEHSFTAIASAVETDMPPYVIVAGQPARPRGLNTVGLRRHGFSPPTLKNLRRAYKIAYRSGLAAHEAVTVIRERLDPSPELERFSSFLDAAGRASSR